MKRASRLVCAAILFAIAATGKSQESFDPRGIWTALVSNMPADSECGEVTATSEMRVREKTSDGNYVGTVKSIKHFERCEGEAIAFTPAEIEVRGNTVTIRYPVEGWVTDTLVYDGAAMEGVDTSGISSYWIRQELPEPETEEIEIQNAAKKLGPIMYDMSGPQFREALKTTGLAPSDVEAITWLFFDRMAECSVRAVVEQAREQAIPVSDALATVAPGRPGPNNAAIMQQLDFVAISARQNACAKVVAQEMGINMQFGPPPAESR